MKAHREKTLLGRAIKIRGRGDVRYDANAEEFRVKSESEAGRSYRVTIRPRFCECAFWRDRQRACKHIEAAKLQWAQLTKKPPEKADSRPSYPNAPWYDAVAKVEYRAVRELLRCLGRLFPYLREDGQGRPPVCYGDLLVVGGLARYHDDSSRYAIPDPPMLVRGGYLQRPYAPKASTLRDHMRTPEMNAVLWRAFFLIVEVVRRFETEFVMDATYLRTPNIELEFGRKGEHGLVRFKSKNIKLNLAAGRRTHVLFGVVMLNENEQERTAFIETMQQFWDRVLIDIVYADAGYDTPVHYEAIAARGGVAMIDFRDDREPQGLPHHDEQLQRCRTDPDWPTAYHIRNLAESVNSVFMRTIANGLRSRFPECLMNEAMLLCVVYNLIRLIHARYEFGIEIPWADERAMRIIDGLDEEPRLE
jgi:hypothetical protein